MPYLQLIDAATRRATVIREAVARLGRSRECTVVLDAAETDVVSGVHAELRHTGAEWRLSDLASRNGTFVNGRRLDGPVALRPGDVITLGETGPRLTVAAVSEPLAATAPEQPGLPAPDVGGGHPGSRAYGVTLLDAATGRRYEARGVRIRLGRGRGCEVRAVSGSENVVSRVHAELMVGPSGALVVRDVGSTHGTFLNDEPVMAPVPVRLGDHIMLGRGGPVLIVEGLGTARRPVARQPAAPGKRTVKGLSLALLLVVAGIAGVYWLLSR